MARIAPECRVMFITDFAAVALRQRGVTRREAAVLAKPSLSPATSSRRSPP